MLCRRCGKSSMEADVRPPRLTRAPGRRPGRVLRDPGSRTRYRAIAWRRGGRFPQLPNRCVNALQPDVMTNLSNAARRPVESDEGLEPDGGEGRRIRFGIVGRTMVTMLLV